MTDPEHHLSGQRVTTVIHEQPITTERFLDETLQDWAARHRQAIQEFENASPR